MIKAHSFKNLADLLKVFSSEEKCLEHLMKMRWGNTPYCPHCGCQRIFRFKDNKTFKCAECRVKFSVKVGSIFEDSKIPLQKWFIAIYLITSHKKGISSLQLSKDLGVTQKTAWFINHRLRHASKTNSFNQPLKNIVEVDETYAGGKEKNKHLRKRTKGIQGRSVEVKTPVLALVERQGNVRAKTVYNVDSQSVSSYIANNVVFGTRVMTDQYHVYNIIKMMYKHFKVNHSIGQYVKKDIHTNTIEGFFSLFKRGIIGIYHFVSSKHLYRYLIEFTFRYNSKSYTEEDRFNLLLQNATGRLTYNQLIS